MADCKCPLNLPARAEVPVMDLYGKGEICKKLFSPNYN